MDGFVRLGLLQYAVTEVGSVEAWAAKFDDLVAEGAQGAEFLVMPEYACMEVAHAFPGCGGSAALELAAVCDVAERLLGIMQACAMAHAVWLVPGTLPWRDADGTVRNRAPIISPDGAVQFQDKRMMTRFEAETWGVRGGTPPSVFRTPFGTIGIATCYDVEFPVLVRAQVEAGAWLIVVPTCTESLHGFNRVRLSAQARALENQVFVAVSPTVGSAPWLASLDSNRGQAAVFGPVDRGFAEDGVVVRGEMDRGQWVFATLSRSTLDAARDDGAVRNHRDWVGSMFPALPLSLEFGLTPDQRDYIERLEADTRRPVESGMRRSSDQSGQQPAVLPDDKLLELARRHRMAGDHIQGFLYGDTHVIRDLRKPDNQVIWRNPASEEQAFRDQLDIEYMRFAMEPVDS